MCGRFSQSFFSENLSVSLLARMLVQHLGTSVFFFMSALKVLKTFLISKTKYYSRNPRKFRDVCVNVRAFITRAGRQRTTFEIAQYGPFVQEKWPTLARFVCINERHQAVESPSYVHRSSAN